MNPLKLLPVATLQISISHWFPCIPLTFFSSVNHETFLIKWIILPRINQLTDKFTQNIFSETSKYTKNYREKMSQVFRLRSIIRALSRTHPELILGSFQGLF